MGYMAPSPREDLFRAAIANLEVEIKAVGVPFVDLRFMVYQVKYDRVHKGFPGTIACQPPFASIAMPATIASVVSARGRA